MIIQGIGIVAVVRLMSSSKANKSKLPSVTLPTPVVTPSRVPIKFKDGALQLNLHVKPGAKVSRVADMNENQIGLQVHSHTSCMSH